MLYFAKPIGYLTDKDFDNNGNLITPELQDKIVIIMIKASFCGYCKMAMPAFQETANKNKKVTVFFASIHGDGKEEGEKELNSRIKKIDPSFRGFPAYCAYKNGKYIKSHDGGRTVNDLEKFLNSLS